jgi:hypothetical protein
MIMTTLILIMLVLVLVWELTTLTFEVLFPRFLCNLIDVSLLVISY